jgi:hypothetical protein
MTRSTGRPISKPSSGPPQLRPQPVRPDGSMEKGPPPKGG